MAYSKWTPSHVREKSDFQDHTTLSVSESAEAGKIPSQIHKEQALDFCIVHGQKGVLGRWLARQNGQGLGAPFITSLNWENTNRKQGTWQTKKCEK